MANHTQAVYLAIGVGVMAYGLATGTVLTTIAAEVLMLAGVTAAQGDARDGDA